MAASPAGDERLVAALVAWWIGEEVGEDTWAPTTGSQAVADVRDMLATIEAAGYDIVRRAEQSHSHRSLT